MAQTQHLRPSLTNISPRNVEPSYYESERLYNRSDSSEEGREEVKDECHWPSEGGKYSSLGLEDLDLLMYTKKFGGSIVRSRVGTRSGLWLPFLSEC